MILSKLRNLSEAPVAVGMLEDDVHDKEWLSDS